MDKELPQMQKLSTIELVAKEIEQTLLELNTKIPKDELVTLIDNSLAGNHKTGIYSFHCKQCGGIYSFDDRNIRDFWNKLHKLLGCRKDYAPHEKKDHTITKIMATARSSEGFGAISQYGEKLLLEQMNTYFDLNRIKKEDTNELTGTETNITDTETLPTDNTESGSVVL